MSQPGSIPRSGAGAGPPAAVVVSATVGTGDDAAGGVRCCDRGSGGPRCQVRSQIYLRRPGGLHHSACADWNSCLARFSRPGAGRARARRRDAVAASRDKSRSVMETILVCAGADRSDVAAEVGIEGDWVRLGPRRTGVP